MMNSEKDLEKRECAVVEHLINSYFLKWSKINIERSKFFQEPIFRGNFSINFR